MAKAEVAGDFSPEKERGAAHTALPKAAGEVSKHPEFWGCLIMLVLVAMTQDRVD